MIEVSRVFQETNTVGGLDLEAWETYVRDRVMSAGAKEMEKMMQQICDERKRGQVKCSCGETMKNLGLKEKTIQTLLGLATIKRALFACIQCGEHKFPDDQRMGIEKTSYSPGAKRVMARAGSRSSFQDASEDLDVYANLDINRKEIERVTKEIGQEVGKWKSQECSQNETIPIMYVSFDGTGIPMQKKALKGRSGKQPDGSAKTREVKLGCIFTQASTDTDGRPVRDPESTTYVGAIETSDDFGWRIHEEAIRRGLQFAKKVVILSDGARYNKSIAEKHFPFAIHIIDLFHAREHLYNILKFLSNESEKENLESKWLALLDEGQIASLVADIRRQEFGKMDIPDKVITEINYFAENAPHMRYSDYRAQGLFVGSGVIEAGCKTLIGGRLKNSGMFWSVDGANAVIALRCCMYSHRFEDFWEERAA